MENPRSISDRLLKTDAVYYCLLAMGIMDLLLITFANHISFFVDEWFLIPTVLFLAFTACRNKTITARQVLLAGAVMVGWFLLTQLIHHHRQLQVRPLGIFASVYLLALPFASLVGDGDSNKGFGLYAKVYLAAMGIVLGMTILLVLEMVPAFMKSDVFVWRYGIYVVAHPSQLGGMVLPGLGFSIVGFMRAKKLAGKIGMGIMVVLMFVVLALTRCNSAVWMAYMLLAACVFMLINRGGVVRFIAGVLAALVVFAAAIGANELIVDWHWAMFEKTRVVKSIESQPANTEEQQQPAMMNQMVASNGSVRATRDRSGAVENKPAAATASNTQANEMSVLQRTLKIFGTMNGRTNIWRGILGKINDDPKDLWFGLDYSMYTLESIGIDHPHTHNSWIETLAVLGIPGFLMVALLTVVALWHVAQIVLGKGYEPWKKCVALMVIGLFGVGFTEPDLFLGGHFLPGGNNLHPIDFTFFLCLGYMIEWRRLHREGTKQIANSLVDEQ